jgi:hypothetical protein
MQYLHHLMPFVDVDFLVDRDSNSPWAKGKGRFMMGMQGG